MTSKAEALRPRRGARRRQELGGRPSPRSVRGSPRRLVRPDSATRELVAAGFSDADANSQARLLGKEQLGAAITERLPYASEPTLGANTRTRLIRQASATHRVRMWFCGLVFPERHLARVRRASCETDMTSPRTGSARYISSQESLISLLPHLDVLDVYDDSAEAGDDGAIPDPRMVLRLLDGDAVYPSSEDHLEQIPAWAMAIVQAALELAER